MVEFDHVVFDYGDGKGILNDFSLKIPYGELVCLIGPSGCGKTTILKLIERVIHPSSGTVTTRENFGVPNHIVRSRIGYVAQSGNMLNHMTIRENFDLQAKLRKCSIDHKLFNTTNFSSSLIDKYPTELSGGQLQRASLMKALIGYPNLLLLDEPFSALDPIVRDKLQIELANLHYELPDITIIMVTHDVSEALILADKIAVMDKGILLDYGTPNDIWFNPKNDLVSKFIGKTSDTPSIFWNSWRITALEKMKKSNSDEILVVDSDKNPLGTLSKSIIEESLNTSSDKLVTLKSLLNNK